MKFRSIVLGIAAVLMGFATGCDPGVSRAGGPVSGTTRPVAVVELFTSEGCSSCPPADAAIADLAGESRKNGTRIFPISFHVDYWNHLGWTDRFSDAAYSARQREYARSLGDGDVYTPQAVVNGRVGFVGSDREKLKQEVANALQNQAIVTVELKVRTDDRRLIVEYKLAGAPDGAVFNLAAVERDLQTKVDAGENGGKTLRHANVVRGFQTIAVGSANTGGQATLNLPGDAEIKNVSVVGYVQDGKTRAVIGASGTDAAVSGE